MFLQNPLALIALFGLLVPLLIHLWERRQGRRVLVGSIRWLEAAEERRVSRLRFTDLWRWLLRSLIVVLFILLLAGAGWRSSSPEPASHHWVLIEPLQAEGTTLNRVLDSLQRSGHTVRWLAAGFPEWKRDAAPPPYDTTAHYWSYLREIAIHADPPDTVTVLARPRLRHFRGERPGLPFVVHWRSLPEGDASSFLGAAWQTAESIRLLLGSGDSERLTLHSAKVPANAGRHSLPPPFPALVLEADDRPGAWRARLAGSEQAAVAVTPLPRRFVRLYYDRERNQEQRSLRAALRAAEAFTGLSIESSWLPVAEAAPPESPPAPDEWLFWLSEAPLPEALATAYAPRLLRYAKTAHPETQSHYVQPDGDSYIIQQAPGTDDAGPAIDDRLPAELIRLLFAEAVRIPPGTDQRYLDEQQLQPAFHPAPPRSSERQPEQHSLHLPLWIALCGLFLLERLTVPKKG